MSNYYKSLLTVSLSCLIISLFFWNKSNAMTSKEMTHAQKNWNSNQCMECHQTTSKLTGLIEKEHPKFHSDVFVKYTHGKHEVSSPQKCLNCHEPQSCKSCHSIAPDNHTEFFKSPQLKDFSSNQHILLGRMNKKSCLTCHQDSVTNCTTCHENKELQKWQKDLQYTKTTWSYLFEN